MQMDRILPEGVDGGYDISVVDGPAARVLQRPGRRAVTVEPKVLGQGPVGGRDRQHTLIS